MIGTISASGFRTASNCSSAAIAAACSATVTAIDSVREPVFIYAEAQKPCLSSAIKVLCGNGWNRKYLRLFRLSMPNDARVFLSNW